MCHPTLIVFVEFHPSLSMHVWFIFEHFSHHGCMMASDSTVRFGTELYCHMLFGGEGSKVAIGGLVMDVWWCMMIYVICGYRWIPLDTWLLFESFLILRMPGSCESLALFERSLASGGAEFGSEELSRSTEVVSEIEKWISLRLIFCSSFHFRSLSLPGWAGGVEVSGRFLRGVAFSICISGNPTAGWS